MKRKECKKAATDTFTIDLGEGGRAGGGRVGVTIRRSKKFAQRRLVTTAPSTLHTTIVKAHHTKHAGIGRQIYYWKFHVINSCLVR